MDNRVAIPGYKRWLDPTTGAAPPVHVAFLDVEEDPAHDVQGAIVEVDVPTLFALDARERNYTRVDLDPARVDGAQGGPLVTYVGSPDGRARLAEGRAAGTAVVARAYLDLVLERFAALGLLDAFDATPLDLPVIDLVRVDLPADGPTTFRDG
ncbi:hypothetical protein [Conexibacter sp. SYSU D00693]|uniref:hypothetical protein n=1 Tax=Conexibacter sp. SYSU D00693 TaxID=2812560 RepID=UPI00196AACFE|nr:hypothetical protein [Conexibacter sp. SYSU D00693]